jgi:transcriptional regulator with XRE-family HTH domain
MTKAPINTTAGPEQTAAQRIKAGRLALTLNQSELAKLVGISSQALANWEHGKFQPAGDNLIKLSNALNTTPEYIVFGITKHQQTSAELTAILHGDRFKQAFHEAIHSMLIQSEDMEWIRCHNQSSIAPMADIALLKLKQAISRNPA